MRLRWILLPVLGFALAQPFVPDPRPSAASEPPPVYVPATDDYDRFVRRGRCPMIADYLRERVTDEEAAELAAQVARWIEEPDWWSPAIADRRGVVFVASADEAPAVAEAARVCGRAAGWLRSDLRARLDPLQDELRCDGNVCCYAGAEYRPSGLVAFRKVGDTWALDAWVQLADVGLADEVVEANIAHVVESLDGLATRPACRR